MLVKFGRDGKVRDDRVAGADDNEAGKAVDNDGRGRVANACAMRTTWRLEEGEVEHIMMRFGICEQ
jgi:hypothetical protein